MIFTQRTEPEQELHKRVREVTEKNEKLCDRIEQLNFDVGIYQVQCDGLSKELDEVKEALVKEKERYVQILEKYLSLLEKTTDKMEEQNNEK